MWNKIKSIFSQFWNKLFFWRKEEIGKDPTKSWPYGHKLGAKVYYFPDKKQLGLESRLSRKFRGAADD